MQHAQATRRWDRAAFEELYDQYAAPLTGFVYRQVGDRHLAEDIVQDCFLIAWRDQHRLRDAGAVRAWLYGIAYRRAADERRRTAAVPVGELPDVADRAAGADPSDVAEQREAVTLVWAAAQGLERRQRAVLELSVRGGFSSPEIARVLGVSRAHAAVLVHRSRSALGTALRALLVTRQRGRCSGLDALVGSGHAVLTARQRSSVDHHVRLCPRCRRLAATVGSGTLLVTAFALADSALGEPPPLRLVADERLPAGGGGGRVLAAGVTVAVVLGAVTYGLWPAPERPRPQAAPSPTPAAAVQTDAPSPSASPSPRRSATRSPSKSPRPAPTRANPAEKEVLDLVNAERAKAGCEPLSAESRLRSAAVAHARDMSARDFFDHTNPDGEGPGERIDRTGYKWQAYGENIAAGQRTAEDVMRSWMDSPGHRDNILNCDYRELGVGMITSDSGRSPLWVQVFGTPA